MGDGGLARLALAILTFKRPTELARLLEALATGALASHSALDVRVVVVDNDPSGSAEVVCREQLPRIRGSGHRYVREPSRGISHARNRALSEAGDADLLAFVDDDEVPTPGWLDLLASVLRATGAPVACGPVVTRFTEPPPAWIAEGRFFERSRYPTGTRIDDVRTGNVMLRLEAVRRLGVRFDERLGLSGGEDTFFFRQLAARGVWAVWVDEAVVTEWVAGSRLNAGWLVRRAFRGGTAIAHCDVHLLPWYAAVMRAVRGVARILRGGGLLLAAPARRSQAAMLAAAVRAIQHMALGAGMISGLFGFRYAEYASRSTGGAIGACSGSDS